MKMKNVVAGCLAAVLALSGADALAVTISGNSYEEGEVAFLCNAGRMSSASASYTVKVPSGTKAEISVRCVTGSAWYCAGCMRVGFSGGHTATKMMSSGAQAYVCTVAKDTTISLVAWVSGVNDSYNYYWIDLPNGTRIKMPTGEKAGTYSVNEKYAVRVTYKRTVTFYPNGGSASYTKSWYADGQAYTYFPVVTRKGYRFLGWYTAKKGCTRVDLLTKSSAKVKKLYAHWSLCTYKVRFDANGGTGIMADLSFKYGSYKKLRSNAFKRSGYKFAGWSRSKTGKVKYKNAARVRNLASTQGAVVTLYAIWKARSYALKVKAAAGGKVSGAGTYKFGSLVKIVARPSAGHVFVGWYKADGKTPLATTAANDVASNSLRMPAGTTTIVARFAKATAQQ